MNLRCFTAVAVLLILGACKEPCEVPAGKYEIKYKVIEGDCPAELVSQFDGKESEIDIEGGVCRRFATQHAAQLPNGCRLDTDMSAFLGANGVDDAQAAMTLHCIDPKPYTCRQLFSVEYRRKL